jgi:hypothetical protein
LHTYGEDKFHWQKHGPVYRVKGGLDFVLCDIELVDCLIHLQQDQFMVSDPVILQYILNNKFIMTVVKDCWKDVTISIVVGVILESFKLR